jgi:3-oxoacyl-[acyl-carrier protein] reductase
MINDFTYLKPGTLQEALSMLADNKDECKIICGGQSLLVVMRQGMVVTDYLIDIKGLDKLSYITYGEKEGLKIGATTTHRTIEKSDLIKQKCPVLVDIEKKVASIQIRNWGSIAGNLAHGDAQAVADEVRALGRKALAVKMDVRSYPDVQKAFANIKENLGPVSTLVNNAALMGHNISIAKTTIGEWDDEVKICLNSAFYCIKEAWADMCANKWGRIISITSVAGVIGGYGQTSYGAAKGGLIALAKSTALEGARFNITANCVAVGISATDGYDLLPPPVREKVEKKTAVGRPADPQEIADAVAFLTSAGGKYMTGAVMNMMGGLDLFVF